eukprot:TRINITY_DN1571_c0_g1_i1.p1 TRINITY_DN1571_c0_g1~~TRINITY_DN1571_c0_g1_i1.p1  ORF type:complete len:354 (+),score=67.73 TRINITY_DN1571_c0_g1_i1:65-1063(+)
MKMSIVILTFMASVHANDNAEKDRQDDQSDVGAMGVSSGSLGGLSYCSNRLCQFGEGDCDIDECAPGLGCGYNNCRRMNPGQDHIFSSLVDCCETLALYHYEWCDKNPGCGYGEGDCDGDSECGIGLTCGLNNCRRMHPEIPSSAIAPSADCCVTCGGAATVRQGTTTQHPPSSFVNGRHTNNERTLANPPAALEGAALYSLPELDTGDEIKLECCSDRNVPCNFFVAVYHCPPCSRSQNGGIPSHLVAHGWVGSSCAPVFTPAGSSQSQTMTVFQKTLAPGETHDIPVTLDAPHVAVLMNNGPIGDWCPKQIKSGTTGPNKPCVCSIGGPR